MGRPSHYRLTESGIGDLRLEGKALIATLGEDDEYTLGLSAGLSLPTGKNASRPYLGDKMITGRIKALAGAELGPVRLGANLGLVLRETSKSFATELGSQVMYGAAADYPVDDRFDVLLELFGRSGLDPVHQLLLRREPVRARRGRAHGGGRDVVGDGRRRPGFRKRHRRARSAPVRGGRLQRPTTAIATTTASSTSTTSAPTSPRTATAIGTRTAAPTPTTTATASPTSRTSARTIAEDLDQFEDEDGCPELDNDKDGIPDLNDACPNAAEDGQGEAPEGRLPVDHRGQRRRRHPRRRRQVPGRARGPRRLPGRRRLSRSGQRCGRHPRRLRQLSERPRGSGRLPGRGRLSRSGQRQGRVPRRGRPLPHPGRDAERHQGRRRLPRSGR